jgi:hypothetical protein
VKSAGDAVRDQGYKEGGITAKTKTRTENKGKYTFLTVNSRVVLAL